MSSMNGQRDRLQSGERGSIIIMTAILMLLFMVMLGLAIDVSRIHMVRAELQNAADAAALTAARELNSGTTGIDNAVARANNIVNTQGFGKVAVSIASVEFAINLNDDPYMNAAGAKDATKVKNIRFVRVTTQATTTNILFAVSVLGTSHAESRTAVAGMSVGINGICDYVPLAVAKANPTTPFATGTELTLQFKPADSSGLANQDFIVLQTDGSDGANKTRDAVAGVTPICATIGSSLITSTSSSAQGNNGPSQIEVGMNTRMDKYKNGMKASDAGPDLNVYADPNFANFNWDNYNSGSPTLAPVAADRPFAKNYRRIILLPIVDVGSISGSVQVKSFGAFLLLREVTNPAPSKCNDIPNPCGHVQVEYIGDNFVVGSGYYDPNSISTNLTVSVLYK